MTHYEEKHIERVVRILDRDTNKEYILKLDLKVSLAKDNCTLEVT